MIVNIHIVLRFALALLVALVLAFLTLPIVLVAKLLKL